MQTSRKGFDEGNQNLDGTVGTLSVSLDDVQSRLDLGHIKLTQRM